MSKKLNEIDIKIVGALSIDPRMSITKLAININLSRPTVISRMRRLISEGVLKMSAGFNIRKLDLFVAGISFEIKGQRLADEMEKRLVCCPRILLFSRLIEKANFWALVYGENLKTLSCAIECIRNFGMGEIVDVFYLESSQFFGEISLKVFLKKEEIAPCGKTCSDCLDYVKENCVGCPGTYAYNAKLRFSPNLKSLTN